MFELKFGVAHDPAVAPTTWTWLDFYSQVNTTASHLAWPLVVLLIACIFRRAIIDLLPQIEKVEAPGGFSVALNKTRNIVDKSPAIEGGVVDVSPDEDSKFLELATKFPAAAVLKSYQGVEKFLLDLSEANNLNTTPMIIMRALREREIIPDDVWQLYDAVRTTRNAAVHSEREVTSGEAIEFKLLTARLLQQLQKCFLQANLDADGLREAIAKYETGRYIRFARKPRKSIF